MILLATIPHTGTRFFHRPLQPYGCKAIHINRASLPIIRAHDGLLVTTIRDWAALEASWARRGRMENLQDAISCWCDVLALNPVIVSIDCQREARLGALSAALGVKLTTDWTKEG